MEINQAVSVLMQIGVCAIVMAFIYGIHCLMNGFEEFDREEMKRQRSARRWTTQKQVATLKQLSDKQLPLLSPALQGIESATLKPMGGIEKSASSVELSRHRSTRAIGETQFLLVDDTVFQCVPVGISLEEEIV